MQSYTNPAWNDPSRGPPRHPPPRKPLPPRPAGNPVPPAPLKYRRPLENMQNSTPSAPIQNLMRNERGAYSGSSNDVSPLSPDQQTWSASEEELRAVSPVEHSRKSRIESYDAVARTPRLDAYESGIPSQNVSPPTGSSEYSELDSPPADEERRISLPMEPPRLPPLPFGPPGRPSSIVEELRQHCPEARRARARASALNALNTPAQLERPVVAATGEPSVVTRSAPVSHPSRHEDLATISTSSKEEQERSSGSGSTGEGSGLTGETLVASNNGSAPSDARSAGSSGQSGPARGSHLSNTTPSTRNYGGRSHTSRDTVETLLPTRDGEELDTLPATAYVPSSRTLRPRDGGGQYTAQYIAGVASPPRTDSQGQEVLRPTVYIPPTRYRRARHQAGQDSPLNDSTETLRLPRRQQEEERVEAPHVSAEVPPLRVPLSRRDGSSQIRSQDLEDMALLHGPAPRSQPRRNTEKGSQRPSARATPAASAPMAGHKHLGVLPSVSSLTQSPSPPLTEHSMESLQRTPPSMFSTPQRPMNPYWDALPDLHHYRRDEMPPTRHGGNPPSFGQWSESITLRDTPTPQPIRRQGHVLESPSPEARSPGGSRSRRRPTVRSRPPIWSGQIVGTAAEAQNRIIERRAVASPSSTVHVSRRRPLTSIKGSPEPRDRTPSGESQISIVRIERGSDTFPPVPEIIEERSVRESSILEYRASPELRAADATPPRHPPSSSPHQEGRARNATPSDRPSSGASSLHFFPKPRRPEFPAPEENPTFTPSTPLRSRPSARLRDPTLAERERQQFRQASEQQASTGSPGLPRPRRDLGQQSGNTPPAPLHERPLRDKIQAEPRPVYGGSSLTANSPGWAAPGGTAHSHTGQETTYRMPQRNRQVGYTFDREPEANRQPLREISRETGQPERPKRPRRTSDRMWVV